MHRKQACTFTMPPAVNVKPRVRRRVQRRFCSNSLRLKWVPNSGAVEDSGWDLYSQYAVLAVAAVRAGIIVHVNEYVPVNHEDVPASDIFDYRRTGLARYTSGDWVADFTKAVDQEAIAAAVAEEERLENDTGRKDIPEGVEKKQIIAVRSWCVVVMVWFSLAAATRELVPARAQQWPLT